MDIDSLSGCALDRAITDLLGGIVCHRRSNNSCNGLHYIRCVACGADGHGNCYGNGDGAVTIDCCSETPFYSSDYNDCRLVEDEIERRGRWEIYLHYLLYELDIYGEVYSEKDIWKCMRATPEQRCRAALKAVKGGG